MKVREQTRVASPDCFVCRWAGSDIIIWPLYPERLPSPVQDETSVYNHNDRLTPKREWTTGRWYVYNDVRSNNLQETATSRMRSRHQRIEVCIEHYGYLHANWIQIAQNEIDLERAWNDYIDRTIR